LALPREHWLMQRILNPVREVLPRINRVRDYRQLFEALKGLEDMMPPQLTQVDLGSGRAVLHLQPEEDVFYGVLSDACGYDIPDDFALLSSLREFVAAKKEYDRLSGALAAAKSIGYGMVPPAMDEMELEQPEIIQQGGRFGVRLKARASGLQLFRVDIESEVEPIVGSRQQSEALVEHLMESVEKDPQAIWQTNIFGKPLYDLVRDGMAGKAGRMPDGVQEKLRSTLQRMVNDGCSGLICILL